MALGNLTDVVVTDKLLRLLKQAERTNVLLEDLLEQVKYANNLARWKLDSDARK